MRLSDFIMLNKEEKKFTVLHLGVLIAKRKTQGDMIFLFQMDHFYVETFCDIETKEMARYRVFTHTKLLQPYLENIAIDGLFSN